MNRREENLQAAMVNELKIKVPLWNSRASTQALGIGANTATFTVVESVLLAPLPHANPDRLTVLQTHWTNTGHTSLRVTGPDAVDVRGQARSLEAVTLYGGGGVGVELRNHSVYTQFTRVDVEFARVFSLQPIAGRLFADAGSHSAALVGEQPARDHVASTPDLWKRLANEIRRGTIGDRLTRAIAYRFPFFHSSYEMRGMVMNASRVRA
jgi:putative ABC transport system permease protein